MIEKKKNFFGTLLFIGVILCVIPVIFGWNYENRLFSICLLIGFIMVFIGLIGLGIWWLQKLKAEIKEKRYFNLVLTIVVAILTLYNSFFR